MPDLVVRNANIWTGDGARADTFVVRDGRCAFVGVERDVSPSVGATILDLGGRFVMPGFTDAHVHLLWTGIAMHSVDLKGVTSSEEAVRRVAERVASTAPGGWVTGAGWDQHSWPDRRFPDRRVLDAVSPDHPVMLTHTSGHCTWVNTAALRAAGITATTPVPTGGAIDLDEHGEPSGILRDNASKLVSDTMPHPSQSDRIATAERAIAAAHRLGLTGVHAMNVGRGEYQALHALNDAGKLHLRVRMFLAHELLDEWIARNAATGDGDEMLRIGGVKFFADGALGSLTAWMEQPYEGSTDVGFPLQPVADLERDVRRSLEQGLAPAIHAIGDRANRETLDLFERVRDVASGLPRRIEHAQVLLPGDVARFAALGVTASVQPIHATADWRKVDREWGDRGRGSYAFRSLAEAGVNLAFGSDTPVETMDPIAGVHAAVTRRTADGEPPAGWYPDQRLSLSDALRHYTAGPALAVQESDRFGRIAVGHHADFVVLSQDPFAVDDPMRLLDTEIEMTVVGGEIVYQKG